MSLAAGDIDFAKELFGALPDLSTRKMFGGLGLYSDGVIFALMRSDGQMLLKAQSGSAFADRLAGMGSDQWTYTRKSGTLSSMPYWSLPDAALDDPDLAVTLAREALAALR
ncbi:MAG: TfoX/Sxy family protein [Sulfitobacter sp.]